MFKKIISVFLITVLMLTSTCAVSYASSFDRLAGLFPEKSEKIADAVNEAAARLVGVKENVVVSGALLDDVLQRVGKNGKAADVAKIFSQYAVLDTRDIPEDVRRIADTAEFKIIDGNVVYIVVNIADNPELFNLITLCKVTSALLDRQNDYVAESGRNDLLVNDFKHAAGELALHCAVFALVKAAGGANEDSPFHSHYVSANDAELNQNEPRGKGLIKLFGEIISFFYKMMGGTFGV